MIIVTSSFLKSFVYKMFSINAEKQSPAAFLNSFGVESFFEKLRSRDGSVWTEGLNGEIKLRFQIPLT